MGPKVDVVVVGGGPAGLATAIGARLAGLGVVLLDRSRPPIDKACGEGLMPDGATRLAELGIPTAALRGRPFHGIRYVDGEVVAEGRFPGPPGLAVRRSHLHAALAARAAEVGVDLRWGQAVRGLRSSAASFAAAVDGGEVPGRFLVAADGLRSPLRRAAGLAARPAERRRFGVRRHYRVVPWSDVVEVHWADGCEAYVTPVAEEQVGIALLWSGRKAGFDDLLAAFPPLAERVAGAPVASRDRGAGPLEQRVRGVIAGNLALVGDASGYVDALTGEGLALAFHQAAALVRALAAGELAAYPRAHRRIGRLADGTTRLLLAVEARPWLRRRLVRALAADPGLFSRLLGVHGRHLPLSRLGAVGVARLLVRLAAA